MISVCLSTSDWWVSRVIRQFTRAKVSHAFLLLDGDHAHPLLGPMVLEAEWCGFKLSTLGILTRGSTRVVQKIPILGLDAAVATAAKWLDERYNYAGLFGMAWVSVGRWLGKKWHNPIRNSHSMFCSEAIVFVLQAAKYPHAETLDPQSVSPQDLADFLGVPRRPYSE